MDDTYVNSQDTGAEPAGPAHGHAMHAMEVLVEQEAWEERYRSRPTLWSGRPNPQLVAEAAGLAPGRALDAGCGEGADAIWLADRGWHVTAVDIATTALDRAAAHAAAAGAAVAGRVTWTHADLRHQPPAEGGYDLVSAQYLQLPRAMLWDLFARLAEAVAPGGTLLVVGHHPADLDTPTGPRVISDMLFTSEEVAESLDPTAWRVVVAETRQRPAVDPEGAIHHDAVLVARRRATR